MLKKIILFVLLFLIGLSALVFTQPNEFRIFRSIDIQAPSEVVFSYINNQRQWLKWSPWAKLDPNMKADFSGPEAGVGSAYEWNGNDQVGQGRSTILKSDAPKFIQMKLEFLKPFKATNTVEFSLRPSGSGTRVTWTMYGNNNFFSRFIGLLFNCEKMVGAQFDQGLGQLKSVVESAG